jgi:formaldehyde-activating enzyme
VAQVTIKGMEEAKNFMIPVQAGVANAVVDSVSEGIIPRDAAESMVVIVSAFVHPSAEDRGKLERFNYEATKTALERAMTGQPTAAAVDKIRRKATGPVTEG